MKYLDGKMQFLHLWADPEKIGDPERIRDMLMAVVREIKMLPHGDPVIQFYPTHDLGFTVKVSMLQPFDMTQHLYESYVIYDNWIELGYANLIINSCKKFDTRGAMDVINEFLQLKKGRAEIPVYYDGID